ncbi:Hypothetical predicted protein [Mytilus galloprovincialis]|uniref:Peptidase aspartic putative domain-containing protein n=1 Tax=Mytilus galloprovincialis TaxID=29158 RepID=A0A8B6D9W7_MYTGA|nr:Hypothetical predicted protein [Mytilus galloprovincialis]
MHSAVTAHTEILLKTAIAPVWYHDESVMTNFLLDEGAQNLFISQELVEKLHITPTGIVNMQISEFGGKEADYCWSLVQDEIIRGDGPTAVKSKISDLLSGPLNTDTDNTQWNSTMMNVLVPHKPEEFFLQKFLKIESSGVERSRGGL